VKKSRVRLGQLTVIAASIQLIFADAPALANPTGPQVISGAASIQRPDARTLSITNTPGTIINWQGFSIGAGELTRFIQQSPSSAALNRVVGADISQIYGQLLSNGRVFLINPSGIVIGPGAMIDTAGFVASTLNMLDSDFLAGKLKFQGDANSGSIINQGWIRTGYGGQVILVAPQIENSGLIHTPGGEIILAAGKSLTITSLDLEGVQFEVQAPTDAVLNVGKLLADGGAVGVFAGSLRHSGEIRANALVYDEAGRIVLKAQNDIELTAGSTTSTDGRIGGDITVQSTGGLTRVAGTVSARGNAGQGGDIKLLGDRVAIVENAVVDASGSSGGGTIRIGGDYQGGNPDIQNSNNTIVGTGAALRADATQSRDGGRVIVWSDDKTQFYGNLSAQGGPGGGNGGFAEVSGKQNLIFAGSANLGAPKGSMGDLLLDPLDLYVFNGGGGIPSITDESTDFPTNAATVSPTTLAGITGNVSLFASRYMRISDPINLTTAGQSLTAQVGTYPPPALPDPLALSTSVPNRLDIGADITTNGGAVSLSAPTIQTVAGSLISTSGGAITLFSNASSIQASQLSLDAASGAVNVTSGSFVQLNAVDGGSFTATAPSSIQIFGPVATTGGPVSLTSSANSVSTFGGISAVGGNVSLSGTSVSSGTIDATGSVALTATNGSIGATVDNAASLTAAATSTFGSSITINSNTALNATSVSANSSSNFSSVVLNASGDINVGTVSATAAPSSGFISESVSINSNGSSIRAISGSSQVTAADVTLTTDTLSGGGIGTAGIALNVNVERNFTFQPNGEFNVVLNGTGPSGLNVQMGVAPNGQNYSGTLTRSGGGLTMSASADDAIVTLNNLSITSGFDQLVFNTNPFISFNVPNGALVANSVTVPTGDTQPSVPFVHNEVPLNVTLTASGNLTLNNYTRAAGGLAKQTSITSNIGGVALGMFDASKDNVLLNAGGTTTISSLITAGNVTIFSGGVEAQTDSAGLEISAGGALTIQSSAGIGTGGFANPLDIAASSVTLQTINSGFIIGGGAIGQPVVANTENLTISAAGPFNVSTGSTALKNLTVTADPSLVGSGGLAQVRTEVLQAGDKTYAFASDGSDFTLTFGTVPATQFAGGTFNFTSTSGDINLAGNTNLGTGSLVMLANNGSILNDSSDITAANVTLTANSSIDVDTGAVTATAAGGGIALRANTAITTGDLNAPGAINVESRFCCSSPAVMIGDVGNSTAPQTLDIFGSTVDTGTITGAGDITIAANSGLLNIVGGVVTSIDGSTIDLRSSSGLTPFSFNSIDAGVTGTVRINSNIGIEQVFGGVGIKAQTIDLRAQNGGIHGLDSSSGATHLDLLNGTNPLSLTIDTGGEALFDLNSTLLNPNRIASLTVTKRTIPDVDSIDFIGLAAGQSIAMGGGASDLQTDVTSTSPLNFALSYTAGDITLVGDGISTGGGGVSLTSGGGIDATAAGIASAGGTISLNATGSIDSSGNSITSGGGGITLISNTGDIAAGTITSSGGNILARTFVAGGDIAVAGNLDSSAGSITLQAFGGGNIAGSGTLTSLSSVTAFTTDGLIGSPAGFGPAVPLAIASPTVSLTANRGVLATGEEGRVLATLTGTTGLTLNGDRGFEVTSDTAFTNLSVVTKGTGIGALSLTAGGGQTYSFARPATDLFGNNVTNAAFEVVSVNAPTANATFTASDGILLVKGQPGGANKIVAQNVTLTAQNGGDVVLQGKASDPLTLTNTNQTFDAAGGATAEVLVRGTVALTATSSQTFSASGNIYVEADAGGGGNIAITAPTQQFTTTGAASRMDFHGGAAIGEKVTVTATTQQRVDSTSSSVDAFNLVGGAGDDASVTFTHSGTGIQDFQMLAGTVRVEGGSGQNAYAKIEETGTNLQRLCRFVIFQGCVPVDGLQILGGSGIGAYGQVTSVGAQDIGVSGATLVRAGTGSGAYALLQAGTSQNIFGGGNLTVEGKGSAGATATAEVLASGSQSLTVGDVLIKGGVSSNSLARIATTGTQFINADDMTLTAGGAAQIVEPFVAVAGAGAIIEGHSQNIFFDSMTLNGGAGVAGNTSDALVRNLSGSQSLSGFTVTLNGGHTESTTGVLNLGTGSQSISASGGITLRSDPSLPPAHADSFVRIQNLGSGTQSLTGGVTLLNSGAGTVAVTTPGDQTITASNGSVSLNTTNTGSTEITAGENQTIRAPFVEVLTAAGSSGNTSLSATGNQYIRTTNENLNGESIVLAALGSGTAKIESGASQLLEVGYPVIMQGANGAGLVSIGHANGVDAAGNSLVQAVDQNVFAGSIVVQGPSGAGNTSKLSATNVQTISTLLGGIEVSGGAGDNSLATVDPITQTILTNGSIDVAGGNGGNADGSIVSAGTQTLVNTNGDVTLTGGSGSGADAIISSLGAQSITSAGDVALTGGTGINTDALISSSTTQFIQAGGDISLIGAPISGSDAIISNIGAQQGCSLLTFQCGAPQTLIAGGSIILSPGIGNALIEGGFSSNSTGAGSFLSADTTQQTLANMEEFGSAFDALAPGEEDPAIGREVPICR
jgi:filamentous hemagglutinin family protein